jgi:hypothetical protein
MKIITVLPKFLRRKATGFALIGGLLTGAMCWWLLPPEPFAIIKCPEKRFWTTFSPTMRYLAFSTFSSPKDPLAPEKITVWDIAVNRSSCSFAFSEDKPQGESLNYSQAFTEDETAFLEFSRGKAQFRDVDTGKIKIPERQVNFIEKDDSSDTTYQLIAHVGGRLSVLVSDKNRIVRWADGCTWNDWKSPVQQTKGSIFDPETFGLQPNYIPWSMRIHNTNEKMVLARNLPTGKKLAEFAGDGGTLESPEWQITEPATGEPDPNCRGLDNAKSVKLRQLNLQNYEVPFLTFDGRYLLTLSYLYQRDAHPWLIWMRDWFNNANRRDAVLYDLETRSEVGFFANAQSALFSLDDRRLAIFSGNSWHIYDLPLPRPWLKITAYSLGVSSSVFLLGFLRRKKAAPQLIS